MRLTSLLILLSACGDKDGGDTGPQVDSTPPEDTAPVSVDGDGDGYSAEEDCDDEDPTIFPGQEEICDGLDNDCNGVADELFGDADEDGAADCIDSEDCDALDNDGDGDVDEDFEDADGDGIKDCFDEEVCDGVDNNGDGEIDEGFDGDNDGYTWCGSDAVAADCDDDDASVNPRAAEVDGDLVDNNCDGLIDVWAWSTGDLAITEVMANPSVVNDPDGEWFEIRNTTAAALYINGLEIHSGAELHVVASDAPIVVAAGAYFVLGLNDDAASNGGVTVDYVYEGVSLGNESDDLTLNIDGVTLDSLSWDDGETMPDTSGASMALDIWFNTADENDDPERWCAATERWGDEGDYGSPGVENQLCPSFDHDYDGYSAYDGDCNDSDPETSPGAEEIWYDGYDQNCDAWSDYDADFDGYEHDSYGGRDCDDTEDTVNPDASEICDGLDNDCNGVVDGSDPVDIITWYADFDGDGYGDDFNTLEDCDQPPNYVPDAGDCEDALPEVNPDAEEICGDGIDNNCDVDTNGCGLGGDLAIGTADGEWYGAGTSNYAGYSVAIAPDVDGDGLDDLIVGAYYANSSSGGAYLVSGPATGGGSLSTADADFVGVSTYSYAGCSVDGVGDMNGDGYGDVIIGAYGTNSYSGTAYILHGPLTGSYNLNSSDGRYNGERSSDYAGYAVSRAGDVNGDGYADALVGAYYNDDGGSSSGAAYLLFGPATGAGASLLTADAKYTGENTSDYAGRSLDTAGDVNGDGLDDILIGAYYADGVRASYTGAAYLIYGPGTGISSLRDRDAKMEGEQSYDYAGQGVSQAGDVNDDGYDDVLVGAYYADTSSALYSTGVAYLMYGPISGDYRLGVDSDAEFQGEVSYDYAGFNVSQAGDLDNDGYDDVVIGAYYNEVDPSIYGSGSSYVVYGPVSGSMGLASADGKLYGTGTYDYVGFSNGGGGDLDGDGYDDMVVGGYGADTGGSYSGSAYVFLGGMGY